MKKIAIVTSTRAEYGILKPLIRALINEPSFETDVIVTGVHLLEEYGSTYKLIEEDGIEITAKIKIDVSSETAKGISYTVAEIIEKFADYFAKDSNRPDLLIVLGDRYEIPAICIAAMNERIPIAHIAGGEATEGAVDEANRHMVTKMSYLHFTVADEYRKRVIQLGESPDRVYNVGSLMLESILGLSKVPMYEVNEFLGFDVSKPFALMTFHPVTLENQTAGQQSDEIIAAMAEFPQIDFICTKANADEGGMVINERLEQASKKYDNIHLYASLGQARYLTLMSEAAFVLGNTSSGIGEAPAFKTPTVNVGDRQKGRIRAASIVDCIPDRQSIVDAINKVMSDTFKKSLENMVNPYGDGHTSEKIVEILKKVLADSIDLKKEFYDINN